MAAVVSAKFIRLFNEWQLTLERLGYRNYAKLLNAKDYGVPQNRERIFMISILDENARYEFPEPMPLTLRLKDVLESGVDERYYLTEKQVQANIDHCERKQAEGCGFRFEPTEGEGCAKTLSTRGSGRQTDNFIMEPIVLGWVRDAKGKVTKRPQVEVANCVTSGKRENTQNYVVEPNVMTPKRTEYGKRVRKQYEKHEIEEQRKNLAELEPRTDGIANTLTSVQKDNLLAEPVIGAFRGRNPENPSERGRSNGRYRQRLEINESGTSNTLTGVQKDNVVIEMSYRIRKLTERECFRLMDLPDSYIDRIQDAGVSKTQQYKLAGNSIVVACLYHLLRKLFIDTEITTLTLF